MSSVEDWNKFLHIVIDPSCWREGESQLQRKDNHRFCRSTSTTIISCYIKSEFKQVGIRWKGKTMVWPLALILEQLIRVLRFTVLELVSCVLRLKLLLSAPANIENKVGILKDALEIVDNAPRSANTGTSDQNYLHSYPTYSEPKYPRDQTKTIQKYRGKRSRTWMIAKAASRVTAFILGISETQPRLLSRFRIPLPQRRTLFSVAGAMGGDQLEFVAATGRLYAMECRLKIPAKDQIKMTRELIVSLMNQLEKIWRILGVRKEAFLLCFERVWS
ncbi:hypothetical protein MRB53_011074 [Persea americana]|uniref:Uncharacterized protein n=1 Tax=Persea americana TaxID=3435 RepID=A0ACC2LTL9_PERAE|nr:hypothetical protein MRB53_011074 [Persea americana]